MSSFPLAAATVMQDNMHVPVWLNRRPQKTDYIFIISLYCNVLPVEGTCENEAKCDFLQKPPK